VPLPPRKFALISLYYHQIKNVDLCSSYSILLFRPRFVKTGRVFKSTNFEILSRGGGAHARTHTHTRARAHAHTHHGIPLSLRYACKRFCFGYLPRHCAREIAARARRTHISFNAATVERVELEIRPVVTLNSSTICQEKTFCLSHLVHRINGNCSKHH